MKQIPSNSVCRCVRLMILGAAAASLTLGGCAALNESNAMNNGDPVPALYPQEPMQFTGDPSLEGLDRRNWDRVAIHVSVNDTETKGTFGTYWTLNDDPVRRDTGRFPTHESALQLADRPHDVQAQYLEMLVEPLHQTLNFGLVPAFMVRDKTLRKVRHGPMHDYERRMHTDTEPVVLYP